MPGCAAASMCRRARCRRASAGASRWRGCRWARRLLWVLDEPFNALDTAATAWLLGLIEAHLRRGGLVVLTSHQPVALSDGVPQVQPGAVT